MTSCIGTWGVPALHVLPLFASRPFYRIINTISRTFYSSRSRRHFPMLNAEHIKAKWILSPVHPLFVIQIPLQLCPMLSPCSPISRCPSTTIHFSLLSFFSRPPINNPFSHEKIPPQIHFALNGRVCQRKFIQPQNL